MNILQTTRTAVYCMLLLSISISALTPVQRGNIQDLTKQIKAGLSKPEARKKALALNVPAKEMNDYIVQDLIITADAKGITDIFDATLATKAVAMPEEPTVETPAVRTEQQVAITLEEEPQISAKIQSMAQDLEKTATPINESSSATLTENDLTPMVEAYEKSKKRTLTENETRLNPADQKEIARMKIQILATDAKIKNLRQDLEKNKKQQEVAVKKDVIRQEILDLEKNLMEVLQDLGPNPIHTWSTKEKKFTSLNTEYQKHKTSFNTISNFLLNETERNLLNSFMQKIITPIETQLEALKKEIEQESKKTTTSDAIPKTIQDLIQTYITKAKDYTSAELDALIQKAQGSNTETILDPFDIDVLNAFTTMANEKMKERIQKELTKSAWSPQTIAFQYLRLLRIEQFVSKNNIANLKVLDIKNIIKEFLQKKLDNQYFVEILDNNKNKYLNKTKIVTSTPGPTGFRGAPKPTSTPQPKEKDFIALAEKYASKIYSLADITRYVDGLEKNKGLLAFERPNTDIYTQDLPLAISDLINSTLKTATQRYENDTSKNKLTYLVLLPAYYRAKLFMNILNEKNNQQNFELALEGAKIRLNRFLLIDANGTILSVLIDNFEKEIDKQQ